MFFDLVKAFYLSATALRCHCLPCALSTLAIDFVVYNSAAEQKWNRVYREGLAFECFCYAYMIVVFIACCSNKEAI